MLEKINLFIKPNYNEKRQRGEVFTSTKLVNEILDEMEKFYPNIWDNDKIRWFDMTNGIGSFLICIYERLMIGLAGLYKNEETRKKHIIENQLYAAEYSERNCYIYSNIINPDEKYKLNLFCGDTLSDEFKDYVKNIWGLSLDSFYLVGNPPYQELGKSGKAKHGKENFYTKFVRLALELVEKDGIFQFIIPTSWMTPSSPIYDIMIKDNTMKYLNLSQKIKTVHFPTVGSTFCYYIIEKKKPSKGYKTAVINFDDNKYDVDLTEFDFLPKVITPISLKMNKKVLKRVKNGDDKLVRRDGDAIKDLKDKMDKEYIHPQYIKHNLVKYSKTPYNTQGKPKVLLFRSGYLRPTYTTYGVGENILFTNEDITEEEGKNIMRCFDDPVIQKVLENNKFSGYNNQQILNMVYNDEFKTSKTIKEIYDLTDNDIDVFLR